jgi:hypothetical protein
LSTRALCIRTGNLRINAKEDSVEFEIIGNEIACADIAASELPELLGFLKSYLRTQANRRTGFRINLTQIRSNLSDRLRVSVETTRGQFRVTPVDISLTGICVASNHHLGRYGARVDININLDQHKARVAAVVVRQDGSVAHTAFHFIDSINEGEPDPSPELELIFRKLESLWLDQSLQLEWAAETIP